MTFTIMPPGTPLGLTAQEPKPAGPLASAPLGNLRKGYAPSGSYEIVFALTANGEWAFEMTPDGTWRIGHVPTRTVVKTGPRTLRACRVHVGSGKAEADLEQAQAHERGEHETATDKACPGCRATAERKAS